MQAYYLIMVTGNDVAIAMSCSVSLERNECEKKKRKFVCNRHAVALLRKLVRIMTYLQIYRVQSLKEKGEEKRRYAEEHESEIHSLAVVNQAQWPSR